MEPYDDLLALLEHLSTGPNLPEGACYMGHRATNFGSYMYCILCGDASLWSMDTFKLHTAEPTHILKVHQLKLCLRQTVRMLKNLNDCRKEGVLDRLDSLGETIWSDAIHTSLFRHITSKPGHDHSLTKVTELLTRYEYLEPQAMLALAVWKAECLKQMPIHGIDFFRAERWIASGWKALKKEHRDSNAIAIIVLSVRPFLDPPSHKQG
jgi:hypothetical protein